MIVKMEVMCYAHLLICVNSLIIYSSNIDNRNSFKKKLWLKNIIIDAKNATYIYNNSLCKQGNRFSQT